MASCASCCCVNRHISHETQRRWPLLQEPLAAAFPHSAVSSDTCSVFINIGTQLSSSFMYNFRFLFRGSPCMCLTAICNELFEAWTINIWRYFLSSLRPLVLLIRLLLRLRRVYSVCGTIDRGKYKCWEINLPIATWSTTTLTRNVDKSKPDLRDERLVELSLKSGIKWNVIPVYRSSVSSPWKIESALQRPTRWPCSGIR